LKLFKDCEKWLNRLLFVVLSLFVIMLIIMVNIQLSDYSDSSGKAFQLTSELITSKVDLYFSSVIIDDSLMDDKWSTKIDFYEQAIKNESLFRELLHHQNNITALYYGDESGNFVIYRKDENAINTKIIIRKDEHKTVYLRLFDGDDLKYKYKVNYDKYDPRTRVWYASSSKQGLSLIGPYHFFESDELGLTFSRRVLENGILVGNYGIDLSLSNINSFFRELNSSDRYFISLSTENERLLLDEVELEHFLSRVESNQLPLNIKEDVTYSVGEGILMMKKHILEEVDSDVKMTIYGNYSSYYNTIKRTKATAIAIISILVLTLVNTVYYNTVVNRSKKNLMKIAHFDALTGIRNRQTFDKVFNIFVEESSQKGDTFCIVLSDIDYFKVINDTYGHDVGDQMLKQIARIFTTELRGSDVIFRWGGEEFLALLKYSDLTKATEVIERIRVKIENYDFEIGSSIIRCTMSFGGIVYSDAFDAKQLVKKADENLYKVKRSGRNQVLITLIVTEL